MTDELFVDVDALAQEIRRVDGAHSLGAGALAEALAPYLHAYAREAIRQQWRPIESAPKDATQVWAYLPDFDEQSVLRWVNSGDWAGWLYVDSVLNDCLDCELAPSHWMPKPSPPAGEVA